MEKKKLFIIILIIQKRFEAKRVVRCGAGIITIGGLLVAVVLGKFIVSAIKGTKVNDPENGRAEAEKFANKMEDFLNKTGIIDDDKDGKI